MTAVVHSRRPYLLVFAALVVLTVAELGVVYVPGISRGLLVAALVLLALAKAGLVLLYFMHLAGETRVLKLSVLLPFTLPAGYAFVLIFEAAWRLLL
jgi:caa(3)-type oxidase subunit IV